jgi:hypothetical protein
MGETGLKTKAALAGAVVLVLAGMAALGAWSADQAPQPPLAPAQTPAPPPAQVSADQCGAADMADLVGKPRTDIPVPVDPSRRRVYCTTCMVTQDYDPTRLDIVFDAKTGLVKEVKCG